MIPKRDLIIGVAVVLVVGIVGMILVTRNWRAQGPDADVLTYIQSARRFVNNHQLPDRGTKTSFGSYATPGLSWFFVPGVVAFKDPRLVGFIGSGILHFATLLGIFLLSRRYLSLPYALTAVCLYGLSEIALYFAGALWPRGQPAFYVWMALFTCLWVDTRKSRYLAAALIVIAAGVYVFMEVVPAFFAIPVVWFFHRPPIDLRGLAVAVFVIFLIWFPYLRFELTRQFIDIRSQVLLTDIRARYPQTWCDPNSLLLTTAERKITVERSLPVRFGLSVARRFLAIAGGLVVNFKNRVRGTEFVLLGFTLVGIYLLVARHLTIPGPGIFSGKTVSAVSVCLIILGLIANELLIERYVAPFTPNRTLTPETLSTLRTFQIASIGLGVLLLVRRQIGQLLMRASTIFRPINPNNFALGICLVTPWLLLLLVTENGRFVRFIWLLPLQVIAITVTVSVIPTRIAKVMVTLLLFVCLSSGPILEAVHARDQNHDDSRIKVAQFVAGRLPPEKKVVSIGYLGIADNVREVTEVYTIGADFDLYFESLHDIVNTNNCPEGIAADNDFRVIESPDLIDRTLVNGFHSIARIDDYEVFQRNK